MSDLIKYKCWRRRDGSCWVASVEARIPVSPHTVWPLIIDPRRWGYFGEPSFNAYETDEAPRRGSIVIADTSSGVRIRKVVSKYDQHEAFGLASLSEHGDPKDESMVFVLKSVTPGQTDIQLTRRIRSGFLDFSWKPFMRQRMGHLHRACIALSKGVSEAELLR